MRSAYKPVGSYTQFFEEEPEEMDFEDQEILEESPSNAKSKSGGMSLVDPPSTPDLSELICFCSSLGFATSRGDAIPELDTTVAQKEIVTLAQTTTNIAVRQNAVLAALTLVGKSTSGNPPVNTAWIQRNGKPLFFLSSLKKQSASGKETINLGDIQHKLDVESFIQMQADAGSRVYAPDSQDDAFATRQKNLDRFCHSEQVLAVILSTNLDGMLTGWLQNVASVGEVEYVLLDIVSRNSVCNECLRALHNRLSDQPFTSVLINALWKAGHVLAGKAQFRVRVTPIYGYKGLSTQGMEASLKSEQSLLPAFVNLRKMRRTIWSLKPGS